jgi:hypothetical protein
MTTSAGDWTFGDDPDPEPPRQPMTLVVVDKLTGTKTPLELTAVLGLDAGTLLTALATRRDTDAGKLVRALQVLRVALADDDGVPSTWLPEAVEQADGPVRWAGYDGAEHPTATDASVVPLAECSSRRKVLTAVEDDGRWQVSLHALDAMTTRILEAAPTARPTGKPARSPRGPGSAARGSRAASGSSRRR